MAWVVSVAKDRGDGCNLFELKNSRWKSHVASVQNVIDALEQFQNAWIEEIVRVRNNADFHASSVAGSVCGGSGASSGFFSSAGSVVSASVSFIAPANKPVNNPPLSKVLRKNSSVVG